MPCQRFQKPKRQVKNPWNSDHEEENCVEHNSQAGQKSLALFLKRTQSADCQACKENDQHAKTAKDSKKKVEFFAVRHPSPKPLHSALIRQINLRQERQSPIPLSNTPLPRAHFT